MKNKMETIVFMAPKGKGGTYYYYKDITDYLIQNYKDKYNIIFCNSLKDYFLWHFKKAGIIFSIIPFFFKPLGAKKYIFNLHGNYKTERKSKNLGAKLQHLTELNLWFSDKILLTSYFLADKLGFRKKYEDKIIISPLFINDISNSSKKNFHNPLRLLTVSSANFLEKGLGVYDLAEQIFKIKDIDIYWTIVLPGNSNNKKVIIDKVSKLSKGNNIEYNVLDFVPREKLGELYKENDIFVYATGLDTRGGVIMEACSYGLPVVLLPYELWEYIGYPNNFISNNIQKLIEILLKNYITASDNSIKFVQSYLIENVIGNNFIKIIGQL